jgi:rhodanese-related sulfurtransferase
MNHLTRQAAVIIALSLLLAVVYNTFSPKGIPLVRVEPKTETVDDSVLFAQPMRDSSQRETILPDTSRLKDIKVIAPLHEQALRNPDSVKALVQKEQEEKEKIYKVITLDQLQRLMKSRRGILFDARAEQEYLKGHIAGARNVPGEDPGKYFDRFIPIPRDTLVIIYCNNPECHLGRALAEFLSVMEFKNMVLYDDGWDGWEKANMPVDSTAVEF